MTTYSDKADSSYKAAGLASWIDSKAEEWRDHYESNYQDRHEEYYRLWRGIWSSEDALRESERSRLIAPALQQAVESSVAEVEEATFGRGKWFDIRDDKGDQDPSDVAFMKEKLMEDFAFTKTRKAVAECILDAAIYGTAIGELVIEEVKEMKPATQPIMEGAMQAVGVEITDRFVVKLNPVLPQNFLIDPVATTVEDALGVIVDSYVPTHQVEMMMDDGVYRDEDIGTAYSDEALEADKELTDFPDDKVRLTKYYGLVPRELFNLAVAEGMDEDDELVDFEDGDGEEDNKGYVEAIVVLGNGVLLKVEENPYMMQDRPIVAFPWDVVPNRFWGRGVCEKGYNSQKALDTELRARIDALALTIHPMMAVDATRLPRGMKPEVKPGKMFLTNGNPAEILQPFNFGNINQITFAQSQKLEQMVQQSTGAVDSSGVAGGVNGEATAAGISMSLGAIIKRHKRTLINFQELFLIPMIQKTAWRYMQYAPELYKAQDFKFVPTSSLGIIAREYEVTQLVQLLQTMPADNAMYPMLIEAIVENMNLSKRDEMIAVLRKSQEPNPEAQKQQQAAMQVEMAKEQATAEALQAQAAEANARARKYDEEARLEQFDSETNRIKAVATGLKEGDADDKEFEKRARVAELVIKERQSAAKQPSAAPMQSPVAPMQPPVAPVQPPVAPVQPLM